MDCIISSLVENNQIIPVVAVGGGLVFVTIATVFSSLRSIAVHKAREQTKRELAAYVAEGTISADKAVEILNAGGKSKGPGGSCCA
jgi:hypothetical protein